MSSSNFEISDNSFELTGTSTSHSLKSSFGIISDRSNSNDNIFRNTFEGVDIGIQTQNNNSQLTIRCNTFSNDNLAHRRAAWYSVKVNSTDQLLQQGSDLCRDPFTGDPYAAGNEWKEYCDGTGEKDIKMSATNPLDFLYWAHLNDISENSQSTKPLCSTPVWESKIRDCRTNKMLNSCQCPNPAIPCSGAKSGATTGTDALLSQINILNNQIDSLQAFLNNGDNQYFADNIHSDLAPGLVKNEILAASPYISDRILFAAINEKPTPLPPGILKEIVSANSPLSSGVLNSISLRSPAIPQGIMKEILKLQVGISERTIIENQITWLKSQKAALENLLFQAYTDQSDQASLVTYMQQSENPEVQKQLALLLSESGNFLDARIALNDMLIYSDVTNIDENSAFFTIQNLIFDLIESGTELDSITPVQVQQIRDVSETGTGAAFLAKHILYILFGEVFEYPIEEFDESSMRLFSDLVKIEKPADFARIYPNPNNGLMQLQYSLNDNKEGELVIMSISGKEISRFKLDPLNNLLRIPETSLSQGIYFYKVVSGDKLIHSDRLVIIR